VVVVRSAVPPGTTEELIRPLIERHSGKREGADFELAVSPQFLIGAAPGTDHAAASRPRMTVIAARSQGVAYQLRDLIGPLGGELRLFDDPATAELIKCTDSLFNATKISFWNEIWRVCNLLDLDPDQVASAVAASAEGSMNPQYGIHGGAPYGGGRLPRDTRGFLGFAAELGLPMPLLSAVVGVNSEFEWQLAAELDGANPVSAIPRSRPEVRIADLTQNQIILSPDDDAPALPRRPRIVRGRQPRGPKIPRQRLR
jgi:UDPglucose 6-dehydrogenase